MNLPTALRYDEEIAEEVLKGVSQMKESVTYQKILRDGEAIGRVEGEARGRVEGEREMLLRLGTLRFGRPSKAVESMLTHVDSAERLISLAERLFAVEMWDELIEN